MSEIEKQNTGTNASVGVETLVIQLLREFFDNKDKMKEIKKERNDFWETGEGCTGTNKISEHLDGIGTKETGIDCIEAIRNDLENATLCPFCEKRNHYFIQLKKLKGRNTGILRSLRAKVA